MKWINGKCTTIEKWRSYNRPKYTIENFPKILYMSQYIHKSQNRLHRIDKIKKFHYFQAYCRLLNHTHLPSFLLGRLDLVHGRWNPFFVVILDFSIIMLSLLKRGSAERRVMREEWEAEMREEGKIRANVKLIWYWGVFLLVLVGSFLATFETHCKTFRNVQKTFQKVGYFAIFEKRCEKETFLNV